MKENFSNCSINLEASDPPEHALKEQICSFLHTYCLGGGGGGGGGTREVDMASLSP